VEKCEQSLVSSVSVSNCISFYATAHRINADRSPLSYFIYVLVPFLMHFTVSCYFSNKFRVGGSIAVMLLYRTGGVVWALKPPVGSCT
jgi:hypothetical protein